jgi:hypothetical protein
LPRHLQWSVQRALKGIDPQMHYERTRPNQIVSAKLGKSTVYYVARLTFQKLDERIVEILEKQFPRGGPQPMVNRVDLALDLAARTKEGAADLQHFFDRALLKRGHRVQHQITRFGNTQYIGNRGGRTSVALYSDKADRHKGGACCHIEFRLQGRDVVAARGIRCLRDLLTFNHKKFWATHLRLRSIDRRALGQRLNRKHLASAPSIKQYGSLMHDADLFSAHVWLLNLACREQRDWNDSTANPTVSAVKAELRRHGMCSRGVLREIDASPYLP